MSDDQLSAKKRLDGLLTECFHTPKTDALTMYRLGLELVDVVTPGAKAALETKLKAVSELSGLVLDSSLSLVQRNSIHSRLKEAVDASGGQELRDALKRFEEALEKRKKSDESQTSLKG